MATPADLRRQLQELTDLAGADLAALWRQVDSAALAGEALMDVLPALIETYGSAAASITADWYDDLREAAEVRNAFAVRLADNGSAGARELVGWATSTATDDEAFKALILGGAQRRIWNYSRDTIRLSVAADRQARGWARIGQGENCRFCNMLIGRGAVYSETTVDFGAHDNCNCLARPSWGTAADEYEVRKYVESARNADRRDTPGYQADYDRARQWMDEHGI